MELEKNSTWSCNFRGANVEGPSGIVPDSVQGNVEDNVHDSTYGSWIVVKHKVESTDDDAPVNRSRYDEGHFRSGGPHVEGHVQSVVDWIATVALGVLSYREAAKKNRSYEANPVIMAFWAPFLLVHLGGPDTITAYALEDNELWPRRLLELVVQFSVALYVLIRFWSSAPVNFLAIPMLIAGIVKFGERIWILRSAGNDEFRDSMLPQPDPGPNCAKFMDGYSAKKAEGFKISVGTIADTSTVVRRNNFPDALHEASYFFRIFKRLFADLILSFQDRENSRSFFLHTEMSYKKSLSCTISTFIAFLIVDKTDSTKTDKIITLLLLVGAIVLEIYAVIVLLSSDWTMLWLSKQKKPLVDLISKANSFFQSCFGLCFLLPRNKRWSNSMAQYNLMSHCIKLKSIKGSQTKKYINKMLEKYWYKNLEPAPEGLKKRIFEQLKNASSISDIRVSKQLFAYIGDDDEAKKCILNLAQSMEVDF
nr:hypothetical protein CFP56_62296 [Quercus suber]